ncbi:cation diffusion facilitator family transporter [Luteimonas sp. BDR2-5]|nr:cation diffusion facilitator family transporter [Luteimonas sp. BDR2-5]MCD9027553.1 cation diffusion facilitator family transporter [Luteimonas sp. BDR2-5]
MSEQPAPSTTPQRSNRLVVYAALAGNLAIAVTKLVAAGITGSSSMLSEGVHSLVDSANELLLLHGLRRAALPPTPAFPFGHGRELYFWAFIVALLVFALGAVISFYEGISHILDPEPMTRPVVAYVVLALALLFEGMSWTVAFRAFRRTKGRFGYVQAFRRSKDPTTFTVLFEDTAALLGLLIALAGVSASHLLEMPVLDGVASLCIGGVLAVAALLLARETKALLLGESANPEVRDAILRLAAQDPGVRTANGVFTTQLGPHQVVAALSAEFEDGMTTAEIETCVQRIEAAVKAGHPEVLALFVKPQTPEVWRQRATALQRGR